MALSQIAQVIDLGIVSPVTRLDDLPTEGSDKFVLSDGIYRAIKTETDARIQAIDNAITEERQARVESIAAEQTAREESLATKVDKVEGKSLSTNDFTDNDKANLESHELLTTNNVFGINCWFYRLGKRVTIELCKKAGEGTDWTFTSGDQIFTINNPTFAPKHGIITCTIPVNLLINNSRVWGIALVLIEAVMTDDEVTGVKATIIDVYAPNTDPFELCKLTEGKPIRIMPMSVSYIGN